MESALEYIKTLENLLLYSANTAIERKRKYKHFIKNISFLLDKNGFTGDDIINNLPVLKKDKQAEGNDDILIEDEHFNNIQSETEATSRHDIRKILSDNPCITLLNLNSYISGKNSELSQFNTVNKAKSDNQIDQSMALLNKKRPFEN